jgi:hypothetical protein
MLGRGAWRLEGRRRSQEQHKLFVPARIWLSGWRKAAPEKDPDHGVVIRASRRKNARRRHSCQEQPAEALADPVSSVDGDDEDPAKFEFELGRADPCVRFLVEVVPIPSVGSL